tara:strand:- start:7141 stop:7428 length:288 start_codon:yes stop_codon:yes gene_type:complete
MTIKKSQIAYISSLSKLKMEDIEIDNFTHQISDILEMIQQLEKVNTDDIEPMAHPLSMKQRLRVDLVTEENQREFYQENAVEFEEGFYKVPKVIE